MPEIVDNAPEMRLDGPEFAEMLAAVNPGGEEKDGKPEASVSSAPAPKVETPEPTDEKPESLKAQIRGLKAELTRRSGNADKVEELENQLNQLQGELKAVSARPAPAAQPDGLTEAIQKLDDKGVISKTVDWQDELAAARVKYDRAEETGDQTKLEQASQRIQHAKRVIGALTEEAQVRNERKTKQAEEFKTESVLINEELVEMYEVVNESFPDFQDTNSELWKAGNDEYLNHPTLMKRMGPSGEIVAAALAVIRNPELVKGTKGTAAARRDVISRLDKGISKALNAGASSPSTGRSVDYGAMMGGGENLAQFNAMVDKIKGG